MFHHDHHYWCRNQGLTNVLSLSFLTSSLLLDTLIDIVPVEEEPWLVFGLETVPVTSVVLCLPD
jgi:hypothetical protein